MLTISTKELYIYIYIYIYLNHVVFSIILNEKMEFIKICLMFISFFYILNLN
jgi:hypothetical protein